LSEPVPLLPPAAASAAQRDSLARFRITLSDEGDPLGLGRSSAIRVRLFLKVAKRAFGLANEGIEDAPPPRRKRPLPKG
jgi:hypothetical protein